ncbi:Bacteriophage lambda, Stf, side tail fibre-repeat-2 [uncultured Caudovirales phage]|uniref:Bacteriophage lambda, Stf, side tail fibre-repeat-2 n=1 Tax=uncultured Caudovirales phage TaxID=2100421 RepID=A0A6J5PFC1_9CAUD|nr:Bacteriophage lambda, Stf, side tail fibre-repeat-2 [uncultured Caudovirales phage]CAB4194649.1 Bacteriophage lambda, Stf, side tail fibre-repeat-2 [uncultured Caudovirales phage]
MPTPTDLVTDLPADFEVFGQAVDTTLADLKGGTSGQVLAKASATDMDFTWTTPEIGDITAITVTAPITGGGTTGSVGIAVSAASTAASGVVQLSDSTSTTSSVLASTPTATKSAYDLAAAAIAKSTVTTAGDIIYRNATVPTRLGIGTAGQVLTVNSGATAPEWAAVSAGGWTLTSTTTLSGASTSLTIPSGYRQVVVYVDNYQINGVSYCSATFNNDSSSIYGLNYVVGNYSSSNFLAWQLSTSSLLCNGGTLDTGNNKNSYAITINNPDSTTAFKTYEATESAKSTVQRQNQYWGNFNTTTAITSFQFKAGNSTWAGGTAYVYGVK